MAAVSANNVPCPTCGASPGWPCRTAQGGVVVGDYHESRKDFARK